MKRLRMFIASFALLLGVSAWVPVMVSADSAQSTVCQTLGSDSKCSTNPGGGPTVSTLIKDVLEILSWIVGIAAIIMVIVSGFRYVTSGGDSNRVSSAKNALIYALVGLVIVAFSQAIVSFVLDRTIVGTPTCNSHQNLDPATNKCVPKPKAK